jgi:hypothetical protein
MAEECNPYVDPRILFLIKILPPQCDGVDATPCPFPHHVTFSVRAVTMLNYKIKSYKIFV